MARLIFLTGNEHREVELGAINTLGRHPGNSVQILDRILSKEHAQIVRTPSKAYLLRDLGSLNGTFVGSRRVTEHLLKDGDEIVLGSTRILFRLDPSVDKALERVTINPDETQTHIRERLQPRMEADFRPASEIDDVETLRRDYELLRVAHEVTKAVGNELELDRLLERILDKSFELLRADRGVVLLVEHDPVTGEDRFVPRVARDHSGRKMEQIVIPKTILREVRESKQAVLSSDATVDSRFSGAHSIIVQGIRSTMCVPVLRGDELLGIMHMDSQIATNAFDAKDLEIFSGIAAQAAIAIKNAHLARNIERESRTRAQFQRFFSPAMVEQIVQGRLALDGVGEMRDVSILFADVRGFTSLTENADAHEVVALLNDYFEVMVDVLFRFDGTLDKYVGDELMALFGVPLAHEEAPVRAVACAVEMQRALREFNETRRAEGQQQVQVGIGINTGACVFGAIGSRKTLQYTVIGDPVNVASRLCSLAKPGEILCSEATFQQVERHVEAAPMRRVRVKGKNEEIALYRVLGMKESAFSGDFTSPRP